MSVNREILGIDECFVEESRKKGVNFMGCPFSQV